MRIAPPARHGKSALAVALIAALALLLSPTPARAEQRATTGSGADATEIRAGQGIEWQRDKKIYIARGGVVVTRGATVLQADGMTAYYREVGGKSKIFRIDANGHVTVRSRDSVVSGDRGVYDLDNKVLTLTGANLSYVAPNSKVTARDSLEYWDEKRMAVARGKAVAVSEDDLIRADVLVAYFNDKDGADTPAAAPGGAKEKKNQVVRYEGFGNVVVESKENVARGEHLTYRVKDGVAVLTGTPTAAPGVTRTPGGPPPPPPAGGDLGGRISGQFLPKGDADKTGSGATPGKPAQPKDGTAKPQR